LVSSSHPSLVVAISSSPFPSLVEVIVLIDSSIVMGLDINSYLVIPLVAIPINSYLVIPLVVIPINSYLVIPLVVTPINSYSYY